MTFATIRFAATKLMRESCLCEIVHVIKAIEGRSMYHELIVYELRWAGKEVKWPHEVYNGKIEFIRNGEIS